MGKRKSGLSSQRSDELKSRNVGPDDEAWLTILAPAFKEDAGNAETAAHIFDWLIELINSGPDGIKGAIANLESAIRLSYGFSEAGRLAFEHYRLHIGKGSLHPDDEPESLLAGAIERGKKH